jgi:hypothetical protein
VVVAKRTELDLTRQDQTERYLFTIPTRQVSDPIITERPSSAARQQRQISRRKNDSKFC